MSARTSAEKTERLLNLVIALLSTRRPVSREQVREMEEYRSLSPEAFERTFERDKDELRQLGIPLRTEPIDPPFEDELGYRIDRAAYQLPELHLTAEELAVVGVASRLWAQAGLAAPAARALRKLEAEGADVPTDHSLGIEATVPTTEAAFLPVSQAVRDLSTITFGYRKPGRTQVETRVVQPWRLVSWHGHWYLTAFDLDRAAARVFRLSRVVGTVRPVEHAEPYAVPADHDPVASVAASSSSRSEPQDVLVRLADGAGHAVRALGQPEPGEAGPGWSLWRVRTTDVGQVLAEIGAVGPDAVVVGPPDVVEAARARCAAVIAANGGAA